MSLTYGRSSRLSVLKGRRRGKCRLGSFIAAVGLSNKPAAPDLVNSGGERRVRRHCLSCSRTGRVSEKKGDAPLFPKAVMRYGYYSIKTLQLIEKTFVVY